MKIYVLLMLCSVSAAAAVTACSVPGNMQSAESRRLAPELMDPQHSDTARDSLAKLATSDSSVMNDLSNAVPFWIEKCPSNSVWVNVVRLAGTLKLSPAVPALVDALDRGYYDSPIVTGTSVLRLDHDPVGRALVAIGDPAIPALLKRSDQTSDPNERGRIAIIFRNIGDTAANKALQHQFDKETDAREKVFIGGELQHVGSRPH